MRRQVVADDNAARPHLGDQVFDEPLPEDAAVHRSVDQHRREDAIVLEPGDEGGRHPVAMRRLAVERLALATPAAQPGHAGRGPGLVDEHQRSEVQPGLRRAPDVAGDDDIGPVLLSREDGPFFCAAARAA